MAELIPLPDDYDPYLGVEAALPEQQPAKPPQTAPTTPDTAAPSTPARQTRPDFVIPAAPELPTVATEGEVAEPAKPAARAGILLPDDYDPYEGIEDPWAKGPDTGYRLFPPTALERGVVGGSIDMGNMFRSAGEAALVAYDPARLPDLSERPKTGFERQVPGIEDIKPSMDDPIGTLSRGLTWLGETAGQAIPQMAPTMLAARFGGPASASLVSMVQNYGDVWEGYKHDKDILAAVKSGKVTWQQAANLASAAGVVIGSIDALSVDRIMKITGLKKEAIGDVVKDLTKKMIVQAAAKGFAWESGTEALQSLIAQGSEIGLSGVDMDNVNWAERGMRLLNEYLAGGVGGGTMSTGLTALEYRKQQKVTAEPARQPGTEIDDEDASPAGGPPSNNEPQAAGSSAAAQATQPAGAPARTTEEAGKPVVPAEGATVTVVDATTPDPAIAAAAAGTGTPAIPEDEDAEPAAAGRPGEPEEFTDIQRQRAADWARQRTAVDPALAAALQPAETKPDSTQGAGAPATIGAPQTTTTPTAAAPVETAPLPLTTVDTGGQAQGTPPAPAPVASAAPVTQPLAAAEATPEALPTAPVPQVTSEAPAGGIAPVETMPPLPPLPEDVSTLPSARIIPNTFETGEPAAAAVTEALPVAEGVAAPRPAEAAPEAIAGKAPAAQPTAEAAPAAAPEARKPQRSAISRQLGDETRLEVKRRAAELRTEVADHPELNQIIDEVADELTQKVKKGEPPAKTVKRLLDKAVEQVRGKALLRAHEKTIETHDVAVEQHAKAEQIAEERELGKSVEPTAGQQKRRRGKAKGEVPAEVAETLSEKAMEARYQENQEDPDLKAWHEAHEQRKKVKGKGSAKNIKLKRAEQTKKMADAQRRYVERLKEEGRTIAARKEEARKVREEQEEEKHAAEASQTVGERQAQVTEEERKEAAERKAKQKKAEAQAESRRNKTRPAVRAALAEAGIPTDRIVGDRVKAAMFIRHYIDAIQTAIRKLGLQPAEQRHASQLTPEENLSIFGKELLHDDTKKTEKGRKHPDFDLTEWFTALTLLRSGQPQDIQAATDLMNEGNISAAKHEVTESTTPATNLRITGEEVFEPSLVIPPVPSEAVLAKGEGGQTEQILPLSSTTGAKLLLKTTQQLRKEGGARQLVGTIYNLIRRMHGRSLMRMVGDVPVHFITDANMQKVSPGAAGTFAKYPAKHLVRGYKGYILINQEAWDRRDAQQRVDLIQHEMTHAATSFAIAHNIRGSKEILDKLRLSMKTQMTNQLGSIPAQFEHAFKNAEEFVTHAFTKAEFQDWMIRYHVPAELRMGIDAMLHGRPQPTWWTRFAQAVANALAMYNPATASTNYLEQVLKIHPHIMQTTGQQKILAHIADMFPNADPEKSRDYIDMFGVEALQRMRSQLLMGDNPFEAEPHMASMEASLDGAWQATQAAARRGGLSRVADWIATKPLTTRMLKREYMPELGGKGGPFDKIIDMLTSREHLRNQFGKPGIRLITDIIKYGATNVRGLTEMMQLMWDATLSRTDPSKPLSDPANKHISRAGELDYHTRLAHTRQHAIYNRMSAEQKALIGRIISHFAAEENNRIRQVVNNTIEAAIDAHGITLPPGWTVPLVIDWVMDGRVDRPLLPGNPRMPQPNDRTAEDQLLHDTLGNTAEALEGTKDLRNVKGVYLPLLREGRYIFSGRHEVATPPGAFKDKATGQPDADKYLNEFVFANARDYKNYLATNNAKPEEQRDQIDGKPKIEHRDLNTWQKVHYKDARAHKVYRVTVQNRVVEMADSRHKLEQLRSDYVRQGFEVGLVGQRDEYMQGESNAINSSQINRLIRSAQQGSGSGTTSKKMLVAGINDLFVRQLAGQRASKRRLKRKAIKGFNRDLIEVMLTHNRMMAGHQANLQMAIPLARAEKEMQAMLTAMQKNQYGDQRRFYRLQRAVQEVQKRWQGSTTRNERTYANRFLNSLMATAAIKNLATVSYHVINATGPLLAVQLAAATHGYYRSYRAMGAAYRKLGAHRIVVTGLRETKREAQAALKAGYQAGRGNKLAAITPRDVDPDAYKNFLNAQMASDPLGPLFARGLDELERVGLGASSGIEAPELSETGVSTPEQIIHRSSRVTRQMGEAIEHVNRSHVLLMYLDLAKQDGMTDDQALDYAVDQVERSQGGYAAENQFNLMSQGAFKVPFQFRKYGGMYAQAYFNSLIRTGSLYNNAADRKIAAKELLNMSVLGSIFAGTSGLALQEVAHAIVLILNIFKLEDDDWEDWENWQQEMIGNITGRKWAEVITRGVPRLANIEVSERMANDNLVLFGDPRSSDIGDVTTYFADIALGAGGGIITKGIIQNFQDAENWLETTEIIPLPKILDDIRKAVTRLNEVTRNQYGTMTAEKYTMTEAALQVLGFAPASRERNYEPGGVGLTKQKERQLNHQRTLLMGKHYAAPPDEKHNVWQEIREFNSTVPREMRIDRGDLMKSRRKREQDERKEYRQRRQLEATP